jgi:hypothetical protein
MANKRNRTSGSKTKKQQEEFAKVQKKDLERFAGSSEEEDNDEDREEEEQEEEEQEPSDSDDEPMNQGSKHDSVVKAKDEHSDDGSDKDEHGDSSDDSEEEEEQAKRTAGMANAMARILGTQSAPGTQSVVLSKTKTPLQKIAEQEKQSEKERKEKRLLNREKQLTAMHEPLSVASTAMVQTGSSSIAKELEHERMHRRVATRGVVALFNAIAQHQNTSKDPVESSAKSKEVKKMTKHGFLDMIKAKASSNKVDERKAADKPQWAALKDDFMMSPKKNWDQESSDEESDEGVGSDADEVAEVSPAKKQKVKGR